MASRLIKTIQRLTADLQELLPMKPEYQKALDKKFRLEFNFNSNHLEGNTLTYGETELLLFAGRTKGNTGHELREYEEMEAHDVAYNYINDWAAEPERPLTENDIKFLNEVILVKPYWKEAVTPDGQNTRRLIEIGKYKSHPNSVRLQNGEMFHYTSPIDTPIEMGELMAWYRQEEERKELHPVELAAIFHYRFVRIHPFDDGNGRVSRLLVNYVLLRNHLPLIIIQTSDKHNYLQALHEADAGDLPVFVDYISQQLIWSLNISIRAAKGGPIAESGDSEKRLSLLKKKLGEGQDEKIKVKKSPEAISAAIDNTMKPLVEAWEKRLRDFDALFFSREVVINWGGKQYQGDNLIHVFNGVHSDLSPNKIPLVVDQVHIVCTLHGLRRIAREIGIDGGRIAFFFYENVYEVELVGSNINFNKLYHAALSQEEINKLVEQASINLLDTIEREFKIY